MGHSTEIKQVFEYLKDFRTEIKDFRTETMGRFHKIDQRLDKHDNQFIKIDDRLNNIDEQLVSIKDRQLQDGVLKEAQDHKIDLILENILRVDEMKIAKEDFEIKITDHECRIVVLEAKSSRRK